MFVGMSQSLKRLRVVVPLITMLTTSVLAQNQANLADYNVVLIPVFFFGPGAHGSQWETNVGVLSKSSTGGSLPVPLFGSCTALEGYLTDEIQSICEGFGSSSGLIMYVPKSVDLAELYVSARARDLNRQASSAGTEIPVVRETAFRTSEFFLLDIPSDIRFRANLRVYGGMETFTSEYRFIHPGGRSAAGLEIYDSRDLHTPLVSTTIDLSAPDSIVASNPYAVHPAFSSIGDLRAAFPQLADVPKYTISITPYQTIADPPREWSMWAFVTLTNNETQEVTTISP